MKKKPGYARMTDNEYVLRIFFQTEADKVKIQRAEYINLGIPNGHIYKIILILIITTTIASAVVARRYSIQCEIKHTAFHNRTPYCCEQLMFIFNKFETI